MNKLERFSKRNEAGLLWQGIFFYTGQSFMDANTVVPVFISAMGGDLALSGLATALRVVPGILMQTLVGVQSGKIRNLPRFVTAIMAVAYGLLFLIAASLMINIDVPVMLAVFLVLYALLWAGDGSVYICWFDLFGRLGDPRRRGLILGWQQLFGGLFALGGSYIVRLVLGSEAIPVRNRYAILFGLAALVMTGSTIAMAFVRDVPHRKIQQESFLNILSSFPVLFRRNIQFQRMIFVQALQGISVMSLPILVLFSKQIFSLSLAMTGWLALVQTAGSLFGGYLWGSISHNMGNNRVIQFNQCNVLLIMALAITASVTCTMWLMFPLAFLSGITFSSWMGFPNFSIDVTGEGQRSQYLVMSSLVNLPFTFLPYAAGLLAEKFGFLPVFAFCGIAAVFGLMLSLGLHVPAEKKPLI